jgi:hypothetical protein
MVTLPVSGTQVSFRQPTGWEDLLLQERPSAGGAWWLALLERVVEAAEGVGPDWKDLTVCELDTLLLLLRRKMLGDGIVSDTVCAQPSCGARVDITFRIGEYLASRSPRRPAWVEDDAEAGWFRIAGEPGRFRIPTGRDLALLPGGPGEENELIGRCIQPADVQARTRQRIERAMESLAPPVSRMLKGRCPECGAAIEVYFDVRSFVLRELRDQAASVYGDVHLIALHYNWPEESILGLPQKRRRYYAGMLRGQEVA